jgi:DNA-binding response OmpR family regulator
MSFARPVVLLTEDVAITALVLSNELELAGFTVAGPYARCCDAEEWLRSSKPDCAVLDIRLLDGDCTLLAEELVRQEIPVIVLSGFQQNEFPALVAASAWLEKPAAPGALVTAIQAVTAPDRIGADATMDQHVDLRT